MKTTTLSSEVDIKIKEDFAFICNELGMTTAQAIKIFAKAVINHQGIPFNINKSQLNKQTMQAIEELETNQGIKANSSKELFKNLGVEL